MRSDKPRSSIICWRSVWKFWAIVSSTITENSIPILISEPLRNLGISLVPRRFHTSGGTSPVILKVRLAGSGAGSGCGVPPGAVGTSGSGVGTTGGSGAGTGSRLDFNTLALDFINKNTPGSKATSSGEIASWYFCPEANPKSPFETNSMIFSLRIVSGSKSLVKEPFRKLCRRLARGQAPASFRAGGQLRSM